MDDLARFTDERTVVTVVEEDRADANYEPLRENLALLRRTKLRIVELPMPRPVWYDRQRLPASYANFYIANGVVLVPTFHDPNRPHRAQHPGGSFFPIEMSSASTASISFSVSALCTAARCRSLFEQHLHTIGALALHREHHVHQSLANQRFG